MKRTLRKIEKTLRKLYGHDVVIENGLKKPDEIELMLGFYKKSSPSILHLLLIMKDKTFDVQGVCHGDGDELLTAFMTLQLQVDLVNKGYKKSPELTKVLNTLVEKSLHKKIDKIITNQILSN